MKKTSCNTKKISTFILEKININELNAKYIFSGISFMESSTSISQTTSLNDLLSTAEIKNNTIVKVVYNSHSSGGGKLPCFGCHRRIYESIPMGIPVKIRECENKKYLVDCIDNACSFNCMITIAQERNMSFAPIFDLYRILKPDSTTTEIRPSPNWRIRKEYGGVISDEEYEKLLGEKYTIIDLCETVANSIYFNLLGNKYSNTI